MVRLAAVAVLSVLLSLSGCLMDEPYTCEVWVWRNETGDFVYWDDSTLEASSSEDAEEWCEERGFAGALGIIDCRSCLSFY